MFVSMFVQYGNCGLIGVYINEFANWALLVLLANGLFRIIGGNMRQRTSGSVTEVNV